MQSSIKLEKTLRWCNNIYVTVVMIATAQCGSCERKIVSEVRVYQYGSGGFNRNLPN